jgi:ribosomal protein S18 acetylase RimI-like enzyme
VDDLGAARTAELAAMRRAATVAHEFNGGWAVRHAELPDVWDLNRVHVCASAPRSADALHALAEEWLGDLGHRRVVLDDADGAERLAATLEGRGWETRRRLFMAFRGRPDALVDDSRVRTLSEAELVSVQRAVFCELAGDRAADGARLTATAAALRAGTEAVGFGAGETGAPGLSSTATLFLHPDIGGRRIAVIDAVATLRAARERGLGRAVTCAAVRTAADRGADLITLAADAEDWPQLMYHALGFRALGRQLILDRRTPR